MIDQLNSKLETWQNFLEGNSIKITMKDLETKLRNLNLEEESDPLQKQLKWKKLTTVSQREGAYKAMAEPEDVPRTFEEIQADSLPTTSVAEYLGRKVFLPDIRSVNSSFSSRGIKNRFINLLLNRKKHNDHAAYPHVFYWMMEWKTQGATPHHI